MMRTILLFLSERKGLRRWMETSPVAARLTSRFIAGLSLEEGLAVCRKLNGEGILATLDHLGEGVSSPTEAASTRDAYLMALERIAAMGLQATISIKLTHFGLDFSEEMCRSNVEQLVAKAREVGSCVEIDMESMAHVERTLRLVTDFHGRYGSVRAVIQSYLRRSERDIEMLCERGIPVRLCKGAYREPASVAFPRKKDVDANYLRLARILLERGNYPGLATHDEKMVEGALRIVRERGYSPDRFEFQMLYGIRRDLQRKLIAEGYRLRLYVPCGSDWYPYFMRRLAERPANVLFLARNFLRR